MKKTILALSLSAMAVFGAFNKADAQIKEGSITYSIQIEGAPPEQAAMFEGMEMKMYFKNGKTRMEISSAMYNMTTVTDDKGNATTLIDAMGSKMFSKTSADTKKDKKDVEPKITYSDEKKTIAGYECKKATIEVADEKGNTVTNVVWYTEKIPYISSGGRGGANFKGLKGAPLEMSGSMGGMKQKMTATAVSTSSVSNDKFEVSTEGYTEMPAGGMMGGQ